jgi:hypothetical protein
MKGTKKQDFNKVEQWRIQSLPSSQIDECQKGEVARVIG